MNWRRVSGTVAVLWFVTAVACGSSDEDDITPRACRNGDACSEGAECTVSTIESGVDCRCDPSGHFFCDPWAGGGSPPWDPCTEETAPNSGGACSLSGGGSCTETNGWCTRTCTCGGTCEMVCDGDSAANVDRGALCDDSYCDGAGFSCEIHDGACDYTVKCGGGEEGFTMTGSCP